MSIDVNTSERITAQVVQEVTTEDSAVTPPATEPATAAPASGDTMTMTATAAGRLISAKTGPIERGSDPKEVVAAVSPAFNTLIRKIIIGLPHAAVLKEIVTDVEEEGFRYRSVKVHRTADVGFTVHQAAKLSGFGIGIDIRLHDTMVIHQKDPPSLSNVELSGQSPLIDPETFCAIGKNVIKYVKGELPQPVPIRNDQVARPKYQAIAALLHSRETAQCDLARKPQVLWVGTA